MLILANSLQLANFWTNVYGLPTQTGAQQTFKCLIGAKLGGHVMSARLHKSPVHGLEAKQVCNNRSINKYLWGMMTCMFRKWYKAVHLSILIFGELCNGYIVFLN